MGIKPYKNYLSEHFFSSPILDVWDILNVLHSVGTLER